MKIESVTSHRSLFQRILACVGLTGIAAIFLPIDQHDFVLWKMIWSLDIPSLCFFQPLLLTIPITGATIRWLKAGKLTRLEHVLSYVIAAGSASLMFWPFRDIGLFTYWTAWIFLACIIVILMIGGVIVVFNIRFGVYKSWSPIMAMQTVYLNMAIPVLCYDWGNYRLGEYCMLLTAVAYIEQMVFACITNTYEGYNKYR